MKVFYSLSNVMTQARFKRATTGLKAETLTARPRRSVYKNILICPNICIINFLKALHEPKKPSPILCFWVYIFFAIILALPFFRNAENSVNHIQFKIKTASSVIDKFRGRIFIIYLNYSRLVAECKKFIKYRRIG